LLLLLLLLLLLHLGLGGCLHISWVDGHGLCDGLGLIEARDTWLHGVLCKTNTQHTQSQWCPGKLLRVGIHAR